MNHDPFGVLTRDAYLTPPEPSRFAEEIETYRQRLDECNELKENVLELLTGSAFETPDLIETIESHFQKYIDNYEYELDWMQRAEGF